MTLILIVVLVIIVCFAGVIFFGAPYLPTLSPQVETALDLINLKPGDTILELGCGDGRVIIAAARRGIKVVGYELNPLLAFVAWVRTRRYRKQVKIIWGDFWRHAWPSTDAIFVFLLDKYMDKLHKRCVQYPHKPLKLVSFAFQIPNKKPELVSKGVYLYFYNK